MCENPVYIPVEPMQSMCFNNLFYLSGRMGLRERGTSDRCQERKGRRQLELGLCGSRMIESKLFRVFDLARALSCLQNRGENSVWTLTAAYSYNICGWLYVVQMIVLSNFCGCLLLAADDSPARITINCLFRCYGSFSLRQARKLALNHPF